MSQQQGIECGIRTVSGSGDYLNRDCTRESRLRRAADIVKALRAHSARVASDGAYSTHIDSCTITSVDPIGIDGQTESLSKIPVLPMPCDRELESGDFPRGAIRLIRPATCGQVK